VTPAEHADESSALAEWGSRLLRDLGDDTDRDRAVMTAHCMFAGAEGHYRAALAQRHRIADERVRHDFPDALRPKPDPSALPPAALAGSAYNYAGALRDHAKRLLALPLADMSDEVRGVVAESAKSTIAHLQGVIAATSPRDATPGDPTGKGSS
jgi:hypothetical protein